MYCHCIIGSLAQLIHTSRIKQAARVAPPPVALAWVRGSAYAVTGVLPLVKARDLRRLPSSERSSQATISGVAIKIVL